MGRPGVAQSSSASPGRFRSLIVLVIGCLVFKLLYNAFGGTRAPRAELSPVFPTKIWQSWKVDPLRFEARDAERATSWISKNVSRTANDLLGSC